MARMIDQIRASKLPSNMMQFAARGALQVPPAENIEILVHLARHNKVFGELARMTLAGWDEKSSLAVASDPQTPGEVLHYLISPDNIRPKLLPKLLENPSVSEDEVTKLAGSASRETIDIMLKSSRMRALPAVLERLAASPYIKKEEAAEIQRLSEAASQPPIPLEETHTADGTSIVSDENVPASVVEAATLHPQAEGHEAAATAVAHADAAPAGENAEATFGVEDETVFAYLQEHAEAIAAEGEKPFQAIGGIVDLLGADYFPVMEVADIPEPASVVAPSHRTAAAAKPAKKPVERQNTLQKINSLDVKGRIQLALKGNKEERSILIRDGTKVVALAVLEAPKISDGEVEKFASQKNVLEAVLRQIPLKRRFMKNYNIVRNLVANPRTPLDLALGLMKHLLIQDLKNLSSNKDVSDTVRKLALKMFKQKLESAKR